MNLDNLIKAGGAAILGAVIGWSAQALTLGGRVSAIEATLQRIEAHLYRGPAGQGGQK